MNNEVELTINQSGCHLKNDPWPWHACVHTCTHVLPHKDSHTNKHIKLYIVINNAIAGP